MAIANLKKEEETPEGWVRIETGGEFDLKKTD